jgi:hypothetical protein
MNLRSKVLALAAAAGLTLTAGAAIAATAGAATPSCGPTCLDLFSREFGKHSTPNYVADVLRQGARPGQQIILFRTSNTDPAEDISAEFNGFASDFYAADMLSPAVALHYGCVHGGPNIPGPGGQIACGPTGVDDPAFEAEYAPFGVDSGMCLGVAQTAFQGEGVTLQPCGVSAKTVWILDLNDSPSTITHGYIPLINGSDTNFSHPFVLTYPANGFPTDKPRPQLQVRNLTGFSQGNTLLGNPIGNVNDSQLWGADFGILK